MSTATIMAPRDVLQERLSRGADILFDMEQRGDTGQQYLDWLSRWEAMLREYEELAA